MSESKNQKPKSVRNKIRATSNREGYDRWAPFYYSYPNSTVEADDKGFPPFWAHVKGKRVLEVGCGTGRHTRRILEQGNTVVGIDVSPGMLEQAKKKLAAYPQNSITLIEGDFMGKEGDQLETGAFDALISALVLEHIGDLEGFFSQARRVLRPGVEIFISEVHPDRGVLAHFKVDGGHQHGHGDGYHHHQHGHDEVHMESRAHTEEAVCAAAAKAGFGITIAEDLLGADAGKKVRVWVVGNMKKL